MANQASDKKEPGVGPRYYGKYRGTVVNNLDPEGLGRIMAQVTKVYGEAPSCWALPCLPGCGFPAPGAPTPGLFTLPAIGSWVWIEFEEGDPERPIWSGGFWPFEVKNPTTGTAIPPTQTVLQSLTRHTICIDDVAGITLQLVTGEKVQLAPGGIFLSASPTTTLAVTAEGIILDAAGALLSMGSAGVTIATEGGELSLIGALIDMNSGALMVK